jgi:hypothetical protein
MARWRHFNPLAKNDLDSESRKPLHNDRMEFRMESIQDLVARVDERYAFGRVKLFSIRRQLCEKH